jgi:hypothetical protein
MALRLRYEIDSPERLREHVHLIDGAGYFFFPAAAACRGAKAALQVAFTGLGESVWLRGEVWARPEAGGAWLELPRARACLARLSRDLLRTSHRVCTDQLVLVEPRGLPALLCRLIEVGDGGARIAAAGADLGNQGDELRVALPEAGPGGARLEACGRVAWTGGGEVGLSWNRGDLASRAAVLRLLQAADDEWAGAPTSAHGDGCRCVAGPSRRRVDGKPPPPKLLLLG